MSKKTTTSDFFKEAKEKSKIKIFIVTEFFKTYFSIINNRKFSEKVFYIDLFCGPGIYEDGTCSTPLVLLDIIDAYKSDDIRNKLIMIFNDENAEFYSSLKEQVEKHPVYARLKNKPILLNQRASTVDLNKYYSGEDPNFSFIDPWGYIDVSAEQISSLVKNKGSDCILFFNTNRILQDLGKPNSVEHMQKIFGSEYASAVKVQKYGGKTQQQKAHEFVTLFAKNLYTTYFSELKESGYKLYVLPFLVEQDDIEKTSHYLLFITKNHKAICEMKKIMIKKSNTNSSVLGYDSKDEISLSWFSREDDVEKNLRSIVQKMLTTAPKLYGKKMTVEQWLEYIDRFLMQSDYEVSPYSADELKKCVEQWDSLGEILVEIPKGRTIKKRITNDRLFSFNKECWSV